MKQRTAKKKPKRTQARLAAAPPLRRRLRIRVDSALHARASFHGYRNFPVRLPRLPAGVLGGFDSKGMASDNGGGGGSLPGQGFLNSSAAMGAFGLYFPGYPYLAELAQRSEYRQPVETTAKELTRSWVEIKSRGTGDKSKQIRELTDAFEEFKIQELFRKAAVLDGFYGLGQIFIDIRGQENRSDPITIGPESIKKGSLRGFTTVEPMWISPLTYNATDPTLPNFYKPEAWMLLGRRTDASRLMSFTSYEVPDILKPAYNFGGLSLSQLIEPYVTRWLKTVGSVNQLISNFSIIYLQTDMGAVLEGESDADLLKRLRMFCRERDNQNLFVTDKERELLAQLAVPISGLSDLQAQAQEHMAAPTHLPLVVLTGITPAGLNASSESEIQVFYDWILSMQKHLFRAHLRKVLRIMQLHLYGKIDPDITFGFVPLMQVVGEAAARMRKMSSDAAIAYIDAGVLEPKEERERLANDAESGYHNLDVEKKITPPAIQAAANDEDDEDMDEAA